MSSFTAPSDTVHYYVPSGLGLAGRLMRHFGSNPKGRNVYYLTDGTITETDPDGTTVTWDQVAHVWWGGHITETVTAAQATALTNAGYTVS